MRIDSIHALNFLGAPAKPIKFTAPVVCIAGPNGAGKSSLVEAIRFGSIGLTPRNVEAKKDYALLLTEGATKGSVSLTIDGQTMTRDVASGKLLAGNPLDESVEDWLPTVLDAHRFSRMESKPQRAFMFRLLGIRMDWPSVKEELDREGLREDVVDALSVQIRAGFAACEEHCHTRATEARGAWKAITGTNYGSQIAEDWRAPGSDAPDEPVNTSVEAARVEALRGVSMTASEHLGALQARFDAYTAAMKQLEGAPTDKQLEAKIKKEGGELERLERDLEALRVKAESHGGITGPCPRCEGLITFDRGTFHKAEGAGAPGPGISEAYRDAREAVSTVRANLTALEKQAARLKALREAMPSAVTERDIADARGEVMTAAANLRDAEGVLRDANASAAAAAEGRRLTAQATLHHEDVKAWLQAETLMKPSGVQSTLLQRGLKPFNAQLAELAKGLGWDAPRLGADFALRTGDRVYQLHSESEQYRIDTIIAAAIAITSGVKVLLLDRFDVLDAPGRSELLGYLGTSGKDLFDTVIAAGTLKTRPDALAKQLGVQVIWLDPHSGD